MNRAAAFERVMGILKWIWYFVYIQFLFVVGAVAGLVVVGLFPSLYASILVSRELMKPDADYFATARFVKIYRAVFWKSLQVGYTGLFALAIGVSNIVYFNQMEGQHGWAFFVKLLWLVITVLVMSTLALVSPTFVDFGLRLKQLPRLILAGLSDLRSIVLVVVAVAALVVGLVFLTGLFLYVALGAYILAIAGLNGRFERRRVSFTRTPSGRDPIRTRSAGPERARSLSGAAS
ncbi:DUF624 domain-containing protein [Leifsonia sp. L25]|uniref:DUF624 domain-containing protein n=1 Tax=Actinomycetes TaxID=1760 RepID=UPI003D69DAC7